ncbi:hypothetical protein ARGLB_037_01010 [Arthrobacter globiformis NBRC 12137]|uniref:Uncharacterized protein n=1 Tax=Arthrobacter globiformis (strain ATCC 8010 / DSM 20124 / JCM 1332 / NBRC 12137 / NCIMB 8907 / NRRL B-2979 / 168) TaxID=1077972 RepID=H0QK10_ARTG1|nr:hypothetical protein [Arthrobacter globiformis]GAB13250.1 hypothetical protein ARGLB_037_01010 [Arthrobacter globiformis NBRC 12137]
MKPPTPPEAQTVQGWHTLQPAQKVVVHEPTGETYPATVDTITEDHSVIWVISERWYQRKAFDIREGVVLKPQ